MRLFKKNIGFVFEDEFKRTIKTKKVLVKPSVISRFFYFASLNPKIETAGLLIGRLEGESLVITDVHNCKKSKSETTTVEISSEEIVEVSGILDRGHYIVGWAHSHPRFGVFMSSKDITTQKDFQNIFSDSVALVLDPFSKGNIEFGFFRIIDGKAHDLEYDFLVSRYEAL